MKDKISSSPIFSIVSRILFAPIILFGLYVQFHGDYGPGGGFQAGVIIAAAFILYSMVFGIKDGETLVPVKINQVLMCIGVILYSGVGFYSLLLDGKYLDYNVLSTDPSSGQHIGIILVELGVGITVTTVMLALYHSFVTFKINKDD